jgi:hypothetical protein
LIRTNTTDEGIIPIIAFNAVITILTTEEVIAITA